MFFTPFNQTKKVVSNLMSEQSIFGQSNYLNQFTLKSNQTAEKSILPGRVISFCDRNLLSGALNYSKPVALKAVHSPAFNFCDVVSELIHQNSVSNYQNSLSNCRSTSAASTDSSSSSISSASCASNKNESIINYSSVRKIKLHLQLLAVHQKSKLNQSKLLKTTDQFVTNNAIQNEPANQTIKKSILPGRVISFCDRNLLSGALNYSKPIAFKAIHSPAFNSCNVVNELIHQNSVSNCRSTSAASTDSSSSSISSVSFVSNKNESIINYPSVCKIKLHLQLLAFDQESKLNESKLLKETDQFVTNSAIQNEPANQNESKNSVTQRGDLFEVNNKFKNIQKNPIDDLVNYVECESNGDSSISVLSKIYLQMLIQYLDACKLVQSSNDPYAVRIIELIAKYHAKKSKSNLSVTDESTKLNQSFEICLNNSYRALDNQLSIIKQDNNNVSKASKRSFSFDLFVEPNRYQMNNMQQKELTPICIQSISGQIRAA